MIARLSVLVQRTSERVPSPKEFLFWQVNETTEAMESTFKALVNHSGRVKSPAMWADQDFLKKRMEDLYKQLIKLLGEETQLRHFRVFWTISRFFFFFFK